MSECFVGEIRMFGGNYAPFDWAQCDGQILNISQNDVLFSLIGTTYGGDGQVTFNLPNLRGRIPVHMGTGPGLTPRVIGQSFGAEQGTVQTGTMPAHTHTLYANSAAGTSNNPTGNVLAGSTATVQTYTASTTAPIAMSSSAIAMAGGNASHTNMMPTQCVNFIIALNGIYPSRN